MASGLTTTSEESEHECRTPAERAPATRGTSPEHMPGDCPTAGDVLDFWEPRDVVYFLAMWGEFPHPVYQATGQRPL